MLELYSEVRERLDVLSAQSKEGKTYLLSRFREDDWASVSSAAMQLYAASQETESLDCLASRLKAALSE